MPDTQEHTSVTLSPEGEAAIARMRTLSPQADPVAELPGVDPARVPRHIAIIMDGNGRWAQQRGFPRVFGHRHGAIALREVVECCGRMGVEALTLYSFSAENWRRPPEEVQALMALCVAYCEGEAPALKRQNIRTRVIGRREGLPDEVVGAIDHLEAATADCTGPTLCLAINYSGRTELVDAARALARAAKEGALDPDSIDEASIAGALHAPELPEPELLVRTGGERRVSNFLLWQIAYSEIVVSEALWPDFGADGIRDAVREYADRQRRFGGVAGGVGADADEPGQQTDDPLG